MRWTSSPQRRHASPKRPWTAMSLRNAVTRSGKPSPASALNRSIQIRSVVCAATNKRSHSDAVSRCVNAIGESCAAYNISSEYALPIPLTFRGSVSARLSVRFSTINAARNVSKSDVRTSTPPASNSSSASTPRIRWSEARRLFPASVSTSVPVAKSNAARSFRPASVAPGGRQWRRPAIMR